MLLEKLNYFSEFEKTYFLNEASAIVNKLANTNLFDSAKGASVLQDFIKRQFDLKQKDLLVIDDNLYPALNMDGFESVFSYLISSQNLIIGIPKESIAQNMGSDPKDPANFKVICSKGIAYLEKIIREKDKLDDEFVTNYKDMTRVMTLEELTKYDKNSYRNICKEVSTEKKVA